MINVMSSNGEFSTDIVFFAFRYCLGRHTGAVGCCIDYLIRNWEHLAKNDRCLIIKEINEYMSVGHPFSNDDMTGWDKERWQRILDMDELTVYDEKEEVKEKRWNELYRVCPDCANDDKSQKIVTNGKERWCPQCGLKEKI